MMLVLVQTCSVLAASDPTEKTFGTFSTTNTGWSDASEYSGNGGDEDW